MVKYWSSVNKKSYKIIDDICSYSTVKLFYNFNRVAKLKKYHV
nr:MAG TPA: hypothetical protein [Caudoviricetes sp.]